ncbi:MAG: thioredoxin domain-containing protein [Gracilibacteraceae bacterium]|jgi:uncharacterized protein YyaL (SSP411 family)|nr:thioredoxin domain-containing protein [Gracilibacteraceae bacterium]
MDIQTPNRLRQEKSPYLRQHADNPIDWHPWGEEAFDKARREDKPVFLSIGYSACHWCHVMEKESFADNDIARLLNESFISVKVDREERPDVDHLYMTVCTTMTGQGGWPLSLFLFPDRRPFFAGSYFPKNDHHGLPGFAGLITELADMWQSQRPLLEKQASIVIDFIENQNQTDSDKSDKHTTRNIPVSREQPGLFSRAQTSSAPFGQIARNAYQSLVNSYSEQSGGFGSAPKFPTPHKLSFLIRYIQLRTSQENGDSEIDAGREMLIRTLESMVNGGIYDHVGGGFCRYSTDSVWLVPHFEKMLYDNALLARVYAEAGSFLKDAEPEKARYFSEVAREIIQYVLWEMSDPGGAFYTAQDADSEGVEGKYYLWTHQEILDALGAEDAAIFGRLYAVSPQGNYEGKTILNTIGRPLTDEQRLIAKPMLEKLRTVRARRVAPQRDHKILTSSNGLMIGALAVAGRLMREKTYIDNAWQAATFIWHRLRTPAGRLLARYCEGESAHPACSDDYAYLIDGFLELYRATFEEIWLRRALELAHTAIELFWDTKEGGLYLSAHDVADIIIRGKNFWDGALPSGNAVAARAFLQLSRLTGESRWEDYLHGIFAAAELEIQTTSFTSATVALAETALWLEDGGTEIVVVEADRAHTESISMAAELHQEFLPFTVVALCGPGHEEMSELAPFTSDYESLADKTSAYVCRNQQCSRPITETEALFKLL